ncbi:hypothetical protein CTI12_AA423410 (mitochondrion) [Artemisia annua]|uniref:Retrovirus-related Pol polyprotein from transposon TNT 1-94-like beta-barrel domain-containing protein n=1 Tax=Artemisia annua TaxID=35608 RepID=A0A2U1LGB9_ARTAN|nr:hypothetical protein CTI12_AA423410 [Artemisia annua]
MPRGVCLLVQLRTRCRTRLITDRLSKRLFKGRMPRIVSLYTKSRHAWDFRTRLPENSKIKQHYKELHDSIKIVRDKNNEKITSLLKENENLKTQVKGKTKRTDVDAINIPLPLRNNAFVHNEYLRCLKDCLDILCKTIEEVRIVSPTDIGIRDVYYLTNRSYELLDYAIGTCPKADCMRDKTNDVSSKVKNKHVAFKVPITSPKHNTSDTKNQSAISRSNVPIINSTRVKAVTNASGSKSSCNTRNDRTSPAKSAQGKKVEDHIRNNKTDQNVVNRVDSSISSRRTVINSNSKTSCEICNNLLNFGNHDLCAKTCLYASKVSPGCHNVYYNREKHVWKATGRKFTNVGYHWRPTGRIMPIGSLHPFAKQSDPKSPKSRIWKKSGRTLTQCANHRSNSPAYHVMTKVVQIALRYLDSGCSKRMTGDRSRLRNFVKKFIGTVRFGNDHFGAIMGYGDYVVGDSVISRVGEPNLCTSSIYQGRREAISKRSIN